jgi:hypothetical protein
VPKKRVIAFTMHEHEMAAARAAMPTGEATDGFVLGDLDDDEIAALRDKGLVVQELAGAAPGRPAPAVPFPRGFAVAETVLPAGSPSPIQRLILKGPLMASWRAELERLGVEILEALPGFALRVRVPPASLAALSGLAFLAAPAEPLGSAPAVVPAFGPEMGRLPPRDIAVRPFDVLLHSAGDLPAFLAWLRSRQVTLGPARGNKVRVFVAEGSPVIAEIRSQVAWVDRLEEYVPPELHNDVARRLLGIEADRPGAPFPFAGEGEIVGVADTGLDDTHPDFAGRIVAAVALGRPGDTSDPNGHGTHVAGSVLGDGSASGGRLRGAAPKARLFFQSLLDPHGGLEGLPFQLGDLFEEAYQAGARVHNNSWGAATASSYRVTSSEVDEFVHRRKDMLIVISAGNSGTAADPPVGGRNAPPGFVDWLSVGSPATCKNGLTVGASRSSRSSGGFAAHTYGELWPDAFPRPPIADARVSGDAQSIGGFSSRGPCEDYRIKPDLVAPGTDILSCRSSRAPLRNFWAADPANPKYAFMGGTSMAAPLVTGCAALIREYYVKVRRHQPSAALLKATLINGTRWLGGSDAVADYPDLPNYHQGFGCLHLPGTIPTPLAPELGLEYFDNWADAGSHFGVTGQRIRLAVTAAAGPLHFCLAYTDAPGKGVQNNLDLLVDVPGGSRKRFGNESVPRGFHGPDPTNNVEVLRLPDAPAGRYLIQIVATNVLKPPQDFALVVTGRLQSPLEAV